jgi:endonuclease YncB( thermonuclease family)
MAGRSAAMKLSQLSPQLEIVILTLARYRCATPSFLKSFRPCLASGEFEYVQRVVDGDTLMLTGERIRLRGRNCPVK